MVDYVDYTYMKPIFSETHGIFTYMIGLIFMVFMYRSSHGSYGGTKWTFVDLISNNSVCAEI